VPDEGLNEMWSAVFGEHYLRAYEPLMDDEATRAEAEGMVAMLGLEPGTDLLDCPCGYGRHSLEFARLGFHVVGADWSEAELAEARSRSGDAEWPRWIQADYRDLPFEDASFDCVANLFSSLGYWGEDGDRRALAEFRRVLRPAGRLVVTTMHRDRLMAFFQARSWEELPGGALLVEGREFDSARGTMSVRHEIVDADGTRTNAPYELRVYTATELVALVREAGFEQVECHGDFEGTPLSRDTRLVIVASRP
jgi:ubiquinone/menaquinone biosynthesis C-methylase UbiE